MKRQSMTTVALSITLLVLLLMATHAQANKASTAIQTPTVVERGSEVPITITVKHEGNNFFHYTNWVRVLADGKEIARWDFSATKKPESETFTRQVKYPVNGNVTITAEANCNTHGSTGPTTTTIAVK